MTKDKAIQKIMTDLRLPANSEDYVRYIIGYLGCGEVLDISTVKAVKNVIKRELQ